MCLWSLPVSKKSAKMTKRFYGGLIASTPPDTQTSSAGVITPADQSNLQNRGFVPNLIYVEHLIVAGGGGGGHDFGGGGGGGGVISGFSWLIADTETYIVTVGSGGAGGAGQSSNGANGNNSSIVGTRGQLVAIGGGGGKSATGGVPTTGGSGGGSNGNGTTSAFGAQTFGQGNRGGATSGGNTAGNSPSGGGGGGAGAIGTDSAVGSPGNGGAGFQSDISGTPTFYAGGGGGGGFAGYSTNAGTGGTGGGGAGTNVANSGGTAGTVNTGGGGGGGAGGGLGSNSSGSGGSGIVFLRHSTFYGIASTVAANVTVIGNNVVYRFTQSGSISFTSTDSRSLWGQAPKPVGTFSNPATSAAQIRTANPAAVNGDYWYKPAGYTGDAIRCYTNFSNAPAGKGYVLVARGRESLDWWNNAGQNITALAQNNLTTNTPIAVAPGAFVNSLIGGNWNLMSMLINRQYNGDSLYMIGTTSATFNWTTFNVNPASINATVSRHTAAWRSGTTSYNIANTNQWTDTFNVFGANDCNRLFTWTWSSHGGWQGWSGGSSCTPTGSFQAGSEGHALDLVNVYMEC